MLLPGCPFFPSELERRVANYALVPTLCFFQILCPLSNEIDTKGSQKVVKEGKNPVLLNYLTVTEGRSPHHSSKSQFPQL